MPATYISGSSLPEIVSSNNSPASNYTLAANYSAVIVRKFAITTSVIVTLSTGSRLRIL